jgi:hypothetical protein
VKSFLFFLFGLLAVGAAIFLLVTNPPPVVVADVPPTDARPDDYEPGEKLSPEELAEIIAKPTPAPPEPPVAPVTDPTPDPWTVQKEEDFGRGDPSVVDAPTPQPPVPVPQPPLPVPQPPVPTPQPPVPTPQPPVPTPQPPVPVPQPPVPVPQPPVPVPQPPLPVPQPPVPTPQPPVPVPQPPVPTPQPPVPVPQPPVPVPQPPVPLPEAPPAVPVPPAPPTPLEKSRERLTATLERVGKVLPEELAPAFADIQKYWDLYVLEATEEARQIRGPGYEESVAKMLDQRTVILEALLKSRSEPLLATEADVATADAGLTAVYDNLRDLAVERPRAEDRIVHIRTAQLAWLQYRKAFEEARHDGPERHWAAVAVTRNRTETLKILEQILVDTIPLEPAPPKPPLPPTEPVVPPAPEKPAPPEETAPIVPVPEEGTKPNAVDLDYVNVRPLRVSKKAVDHIVKFETGGQLYYQKMYQRPQWPGYSSGVTIGFGYDLGYMSKDQIQQDWAGVLGAKEMAALMRVQGVTGSEAASLARGIKSEVFIPWETAQMVFERSTLPHWSRLAADAYVLGRGELPPDCNGALIGNAFNRGVKVDPEGRRRELWLIKEAIRKRNWAAIPPLFEEQRKYWPNTSGPNGLQTRRSEEAKLWESGLKEMTSGSFPPVSYLQEDVSSGKERSYYRTEVVGPRHPIWKSGEIHPAVIERKNFALGIGRTGEQRDTMRAGTLYAASAAAQAAAERGFFFYLTSGNRWGVSTSPNHGQNKDLGDAIDFVISDKPGGLGDRLDGEAGKKQTYDILACAAVAAARDFEKPGVGVGWGRSNGAGHHIEVDDGQRGANDASDVWPYSDSGDASFLKFERDFANGSIFKNPDYLIYRDYFQGKLKNPGTGNGPAPTPQGPVEEDNKPAPKPEAND